MKNSWFFRSLLLVTVIDYFGRFISRTSTFVGRNYVVVKFVVLTRLRYVWFQKGVIVHELAHALGVHHEQTRADRDKHVRIMENNIPRLLQYNFDKYKTEPLDSQGIPYDYSSIMHYGEKVSFSTPFFVGRVTFIETMNCNIGSL